MYSVEYLCYGSTAVVNLLLSFSLEFGDGLYTSEFDIYRRQILTYKDGPGAERVRSVCSGISTKL